MASAAGAAAAAAPPPVALKVVVLGEGRVGKTSLLRVLAGVTEPVLGTVRWGMGVSVGYYAQEQEGIRAGADLVAHMREANGVFEIKEHFAAIGMFMLPLYWFYWRTPLKPDYAAARRWLTTILALIVWWNFLVGHILNNIKGFGQ